MRRPAPYIGIVALVIVAVWVAMPAANQPADTLGMRWVSPTPRPPTATKPPAPWQLTQTAKNLTATAKAVPSTPTPKPPTSTPTAPPSQSATPTARLTATPTGAPNTDEGLVIDGSPAFIAGIVAGLDLMAGVSPGDRAVVAKWVTGIRESPRNYSSGGSHVIEITRTSAIASATYSGSIVRHEAEHLRRWFEGIYPAWECEGERAALRAQADYLRRAGDVYNAGYIEGLIQQC